MPAVRRILIGIGLDRNPMRRPIDRLEAWSRLALLCAFLVLAPLLAALLGRVAYRAGVQVERVEQAERALTSAVLLEDAGPIGGGKTTPPKVRALAMWRTADGVLHTGEVLAAARTPAGSTVDVWIDTAGRRAEPPQRRDQTIGHTVAAALLTASALALLVLCASAMLRRMCDRRRMAAWQLEWMIVEPRWSKRSRPR
jgi:hypothetical protein